MLDYNINPKRSKFKKKTEKYYRDSVVDIIDVEEALKKNKEIEKIQENLFLYNNYTPETQKLSQKEKLINNSHNINVFEVFKELSQNPKFSIFYELLDYIGQGSFGIVVSALDKRNRVKIAIKIIPKYKFGSNTQSYLEREVSIQSGVKHKQIIQLYSVLETSGFLCLLMEICEGGSLKDFIISRYYNKTSGDFFMTDEECSIIIKRILKGLDYMYSLNIIHRDIKPENIMFSVPGDIKSVKIGDFGLSIYTDKLESAKCGTLIYNSPEQINENAYDHSVDVWACGFILYILCSGGKHPTFLRNEYNAEKYKNVMKNLQEWDFPPSFPILARNLFLKMCKLNKIYRYETHRALNHPWITRVNTSIPLTMIETYDRQDLIQKFKNMMSASMFFYSYKAIYGYLFLFKKKSSDSTANLHATNSSTSINISVNKSPAMRRPPQHMKHKSLGVMNPEQIASLSSGSNQDWLLPSTNPEFRKKSLPKLKEASKERKMNSVDKEKEKEKHERRVGYSNDRRDKIIERKEVREMRELSKERENLNTNMNVSIGVDKRGNSRDKHEKLIKREITLEEKNKILLKLNNFHQEQEQYLAKNSELAANTTAAKLSFKKNNKAIATPGGGAGSNSGNSSTDYINFDLVSNKMSKKIGTPHHMNEPNYKQFKFTEEEKK